MTPATVQDRHLDLLLSMALEQMDRQENERLLCSDDPSIDAGSALRMDQAYAAACQHADRENKRKQRIIRGRKAARGLRLAFAALGVIVIFTLAVFPVALAASADFRGKVMRLLMQFDEKQKAGAFTFLPEDAQDHGPDDFPPDAPDRWEGLYFPRYIPEGFSRSVSDGAARIVIYSASDGQQFTFSEHIGPMPPIDPPEGSFYILESIRGSEFPVVEETLDGVYRVTVTWEMGDRWLRLITENMPREEALRIADSTAGAVTDTSVDLDEPLPVTDGVPDWWAGRYYPSALPEDMWIEAVSPDRSIVFRGAQGKYIEYFETSGESSGAFMVSSDSEIRQVLINGQEGTIISIPDGARPFIVLIWQAPDAVLEMDAHMFSEEEVLRIAESVLPCR